MLVLRRIIEGAKEFNLKAIITFIDFSNAFDTIHYGQMFKMVKCLKSFIHMVSLNNLSMPSRICTHRQKFQVQMGKLNLFR